MSTKGWSNRLIHKIGSKSDYGCKDLFIFFAKKGWKDFITLQENRQSVTDNVLSQIRPKIRYKRCFTILKCDTSFVTDFVMGLVRQKKIGSQTSKKEALTTWF